MLTEAEFFDKSLDAVRAIVLRHTPSSFNVFLFGSSVNGLRSRASDIDVGFLGQEPVPQGVFRRIREELEESFVPHRIDLVDFFSKSDDFKNTALQSTRLWQKATS